MASPWHSTLLAGIRRQSPKPVLLCQVDLTDPSSRTLKLSNIPFTDPDGGYWEMAIEDMEPIEAPGAFLSGGLDLCNTAMILFNRRLSYQAAGKVAAHAFNDYRWEGATITFWLWETSVASFANKGQIFKGVVNGYEVSQTQVRVACIQRSDWNRVITPKFVNRKDHPNAPEKSIGLPLPILVGKGQARPLRGDWAGALGTSRDRFDAAGGGIPTVQGVLVDNGAGASGDKVKVVLAGHLCPAFGPGADGLNAFIRTNTEHPAVYDVTGETFVAAAASGYTVPDGSDDFYYIVIPSDVDAPATPASEPRYAMDPGNEITYALIDYDASKRKLELPLISIDPPGEYVSARVVMGYKTVGGATNLRLSFFNNASASGVDTAVSASVSPTTMYGSSIVGHEPTVSGQGAWDFSQCEVQVNFNAGAGAGVKCHVYFLALEIRYKPRREFLRMAKRVEIRTSKFGVNKKDWRVVGGKQGWGGPHAQATVEVSYPVTEFVGEFYANINGHPDDGSGTFTGVAGAQIQRAHDIIHFILRTYLEQTGGQINASSGLFGDFVLLDSPQVTFNNKDLVYFLRVDREMPGEDALTALTRDSLTWLYISRFTDKWQMIAWKPGVGTAYDLTLEPEHLVGDTFLRVRSTPKSRVLTGVRLRYLWDAFRKAHIGEIRVAHDGSSSGYHYDNLRDQYLSVVTGINDKINFKSGATTYTATIAAGDYTPTTFLTALRTAFEAAVATTVSVGYGFLIVAGVNDVLPFNDGSDKSATLTAGAYATGAALATEVQTRLNALSTDWVCTYSTTTLLFTISRTAGTAVLRFLDVSSSQCNAALGYTRTTHTLTGAPDASEFEVRPEHFLLIGSGAGVFEILWKSGTNGLDGTRTDAAELLGYSNLRDLTGQGGYQTLSPKNNQEQKCLLAKTRYQGRRNVPIDADTILDTDTARTIANRLVDLESEPRIEVEFETSWMPDLERGRVMLISSAFDAFIPYPKLGSNGSWAGKKFWVTNVRQHAVRRWVQEVSCIEAD